MKRKMVQNTPELVIVPFQREHQEPVKALILSGLTEHWGYCDPTLNPDLNNIAEHYASATFLIAWCHGQIVGTGALLPKTETIAEVVRMSVASSMRRQGVATAILERLCQDAAKLGYHDIILETTATWHEVIAFYCKFGFRITHEQEEEFGRNVYFSLALRSRYPSIVRNNEKKNDQENI